MNLKKKGGMKMSAQAIDQDKRKKYKKFAKQSKYFSNTPSYLIFLFCVADPKINKIAQIAISFGGHQCLKKEIWKFWYNLPSDHQFVQGIPMGDMKKVNWKEVSRKVTYYSEKY